MARGRAPDYDAQRTMIVQEAARLFARRGYPSTSMNEVAQACGMSKATLYHYYRDKYALLVSITDEHVSRLLAVVTEVFAVDQEPIGRMRELIRRFLQEYAGAQDAHRVLTEDVRFLEPADRERVLGKEREVVSAFAQTVAQVRPELGGAHLDKPLTMLLFGMMNWMFTWMRPGGGLDYADMAPVVADLFLGGLPAVATRETPGITV
jgi:AcrR family transcriptional regulator